MTTLQSYLETIGDEAAMTLFKVSKRRIQSWKYGQRLPRPEKALEMVEATGGKLSFEAIYAKPEAVKEQQ